MSDTNLVLDIMPMGREVTVTDIRNRLRTMAAANFTPAAVGWALKGPIDAGQVEKKWIRSTERGAMPTYRRLR